jgi:hypothetical protein
MISLKDVTRFSGGEARGAVPYGLQLVCLAVVRLGFLGDKWPAIDFYLELTSTSGSGMYFFGQAKTTASILTKRSKVLPISSDRDDVERLLKIPAPIYMLGVYELSKHVFARSIHNGTSNKAITSIPLAYELTGSNLQRLHDEVVAHWASKVSKVVSAPCRYQSTRLIFRFTNSVMPNGG